MRAWVVPSSLLMGSRWCPHLLLIDAEQELARINAREAALRAELATIPAKRAAAQAELDQHNAVLKEWRVR